MIPTSTYRIQFRNGMTFDRAISLIPYLQQLGISHLYASPIFTATSASTHGYDVTDANEIDPSLGGRESFERMAHALKKAGLGLILDIVPNHMASSLENPWWRDVVQNGEQSCYARHFDIDWSKRLTLPFLGDDFAAELADGRLTIQPDPHSGEPALAYYETHYPLARHTWHERRDEVLALRERDAISRLHDSQPWRLMSWRDAPRDLSYRRFFEVTGLVGVRVEDKDVFDDSHRLILELVKAGLVDGLRIDHIDGLADPAAYLKRLRQATGEACYITVEKIVAGDEQLPQDWPVSGTTGYEFIASLAEVLADSESYRAQRHFWQQTLGSEQDPQVELRAAKALMVGRNFAGEFNRLLGLAMSVAHSGRVALEESSVRDALRELLIAFPVYRTYGTADGLSDEDSAFLDRLKATVNALATSPDAVSLDFIACILRGEMSASASEAATEFRVRFQQLTGPLMAKSVEDTLFFRQNANLALNEVGGEPVAPDFSPARFHQQMRTRLARQPDALTTTSTHDTKRGEDARARLLAIGEAPQDWFHACIRWREMNQQAVKHLDDGPAPGPAEEWMLYQALAGAWPTTLEPADRAGLAELEERFLAFVEKAIREAKQRTDWTDGNSAYEQAVLDYARHMLSPSSQRFLTDFHATLQPAIRAGLVNSLTQRVLKLTAPGVPDIYQGSEALNFSLVDPDNRREPDFEQLASQLSSCGPTVFDSEQAWLSGTVNQYVTATLLHLRKQEPALFRHGEYLALEVTGPYADSVVAFARLHGERVLLVIVPRRVSAMLALPQRERWADTAVTLESRLTGAGYRNMFSGQTLDISETLALAQFTGRLTVLLRG